jgi:hypothetical protein
VEKDGTTLINYKFIGWCKEDNHDKVWVAIMLSDSPDAKNYSWGRCKWVTSWGRRGKKLQSKIFDGPIGELYKVKVSKIRKGYRDISPESLNHVYPEFQSDLEKTAIWSLLKG